MRNPIASVGHWLAEEVAAAIYAFERLNARLYDAPWTRLGDHRSGRPC